MTTRIPWIRRIYGDQPIRDTDHRWNAVERALAFTGASTAGTQPRRQGQPRIDITDPTADYTEHHRWTAPWSCDMP